MGNIIKQFSLLLLLGLFIISCGEDSTSSEDDNKKEDIFYKLGTVTFEFDGKTTVIEDFYITGLTIMNWSGDGNPENSIASANWIAKDSVTSLAIGILGADIFQNSLAGTYKIEDAKATAIFSWGVESESIFRFVSGDMVVEKMERDGNIKLILEGKGDYSVNYTPVVDKQNQPAKLIIDAKLLTVYVNDIKQ